MIAEFQHRITDVRNVGKSYGVKVGMRQIHLILQTINVLSNQIETHVHR
jgi:hypothetical protein